MQVKSAILALLSPEALKEVCGHLDVDLNCRTKALMLGHLMLQESISAKNLLPLLTEAELQAVCTACGVPATGRKATLIKRLVKQERGPTFVALDFETADYPRDSACALGLVRVENHRIVQRTYQPDQTAAQEVCLHLSPRNHLGGRGEPTHLRRIMAHL